MLVIPSQGPVCVYRDSTAVLKNDISNLRITPSSIQLYLYLFRVLALGNIKEKEEKTNRTYLAF